MITIVGCGPGAASYLTGAARAALAEADVLIGAARLLDLAGDSPARRITATADTGAVLADIRAAHTGTNRVAVLVSGDPGLFSLARRVVAAFGLAACRVIPGISSVQTAFARIGQNWDDARIISAHHTLPALDDAALPALRKIAILGGRADAPAWLAALLARLGPAVAVYACENLTLEDERVRRLTAADLAQGAFAARCVFLVLREELDS